MTIALPWGLDFEPQPAGPGLALAGAFDSAASELRLTLTNTSAEAAHPTAVRLSAAPGFAAASGYAWVQGRYMQTDAFIRNFGAAPVTGYDGDAVDVAADAVRYTSREMVAISLPVRATPAVAIGSLAMDRFFFDITIELEADETIIRRIDIAFDLTGVELAPGESLALPPVLVLEGRDTQALVEQYADAVAARMHARVPAEVPTGWCSWYQFYNRVTEADVIRNLEAMRDSSHPATFVQVDDGYQSCTGDWLAPNGKFPSGMAALAARIRDAGYRPGLWLAPLLLHEDSAALRDHPEMVLRRHDGSPLFVQTWLGRAAVLDCTHPLAEQWLRNVVATVVHDWGYGYLKLDALAFAAVSPAEVRYYAAGTTAPANLRRGLEIIRAAAGASTFILGCTCHFGPAIGLVDAMRVGPDVKAAWSDGSHPSVKHALRMALARNWMHGRWWANDPDCLIVRDTETELSEPEVRFLATGIALSGGMVVAGDDLPALPPARRDMALALFPPTGSAARPVDPADGPVPSVWRAGLGEKRALVGALNWDDTARWLVTGELFAPGEIAFDVWSGRLLGMGDQLLRPHEGVLWQVTGAGKTPRVVGDSGSLTYANLFQRQVSGRIQVRNDSDRARTIAIEARGRVFEVELAPGEMRWFD